MLGLSLTLLEGQQIIIKKNKLLLLLDLRTQYIDKTQKWMLDNMYLWFEKEKPH